MMTNDDDSGDNEMMIYHMFLFPNSSPPVLQMVILVQTYHDIMTVALNNISIMLVESLKRAKPRPRLFRSLHCGHSREVVS